MATTSKYGNIRELKQQVLEDEGDKITFTEGENLTEKQQILPVKPEKAKKTIKTEFTNNDLILQKKTKITFDVSLLYSVAMEMLKAERKKKNRLHPISSPMTNNGILDEILESYFSDENNALYLEKAKEELGL